MSWSGLPSVVRHVGEGKGGAKLLRSSGALIRRGRGKEKGELISSQALNSKGHTNIRSAKSPQLKSVEEIDEWKKNKEARKKE